MKQILLPTS